jgi:hypothetical protein
MNTPAHFEQGWQLVEDDPIRGIRRYRLDMGDHIVQRTEYYRTEGLLDANAQDRASLAGSKWGDGQLVARIPLNLAWQELMPAIIDGDERYVARWLNDVDHSRFRVKEGKL